MPSDIPVKYLYENLKIKTTLILSDFKFTYVSQFIRYM